MALSLCYVRRTRPKGGGGNELKDDENVCVCVSVCLLCCSSSPPDPDPHNLTAQQDHQLRCKGGGRGKERGWVK